MRIPMRKDIYLSLLLLISMLLSSFRPFEQEPPQGDDLNIQITQVDTSQFPEVTVYVSVTNAAGEPVGVDPAGIKLEENGVQLSADQIKGIGEAGSLTTMLVMDISGSMNSGGKLSAAKVAAQAYIQQMRAGDRAGLITFNTNIDVVQPVTKNKKALINAVEGLKAEDDTTMYDALVDAVEILEPIEGRKAIIVLTDGLDNRSTATTTEVIQKIGPAGLSISTIGLGDPTHGKGAQTALDKDALTALAKKTGGVYGFAENDEDLLNLYQRYGRGLQAEYQLTYTSPSTVRDGVNRSLSVSFESAADQTGEITYNPGGLVPEIAETTTWPLFLSLLGFLLVLLLVPTTVRLAGNLVSRGRKNKSQKKSSIKFKD